MQTKRAEVVIVKVYEVKSRENACKRVLIVIKVGFPCFSVVKNLPANAGDMGLIPDPGRFHMPWSNRAPAPQLLSQWSRA